MTRGTRGLAAGLVSGLVVVACAGASDDGARAEDAPASSVVEPPREPAASDPAAEEAAADAALLASRPYVLRTPKGYDPTKPAPLVMAFHGYGGDESGPKLERYLKLSPVADAAQFLYITPEGTKDGAEERFWNATDVCCDFDGKKPDDVAYVRAIVRDVAKKHRLDEKRVYAVGLSGGGYFVHRLACEASDVLAAVVSVSGATWKDASRCKPTDAIAVAELHGDKDKTVLYEGGHEKYGVLEGDYPSARETVGHWAGYLGCASALTPTPTTYDVISDIEGPETVVERHEGCAKGAAELWTMKGGIHAPRLGPGFATAVWGFFAAHPKP